MGIVVFDLDHTIVRPNISVAFGRYLYRIRVISFLSVIKSIFCYLCHKKFGKSLAWLHHHILNILFKNFSKALLLQHVEQFFDSHLEDLFYPPSKKALFKAQNQGNITALLSSSPDFIVEPLAKRLKIPYWAGTHYAVNQENQLVAVKEIVDGEYKAEFLRTIKNKMKFERQAITVFTDSILDLPLLLEAGEKIAVQPDRKLRALCQQNNWKII